MISGLDASSVQGALPINALVAGGCRFLYHKCQQGNDGKDPLFEANVAAARKAGMLVGAYHFLYPIPKLSPTEQALGFFKASALGRDAGELPPALDLEWPDPDRSGGWAKWGCTAPQILEWTKACAERVADLFGRRPVIYTYPYFAQRLGAKDAAWLADYPLWIASYGDKPAVPAPWSDWAFWQWDGNDGQRLPNGVDSDFDRFNGDEAALRAFTGLRPPETLTGPAA